MASSSSAALLLTRVASSLSSNATLHGEGSSRPGSVIESIGTYKWFLGTLIFLAVAVLQLLRYAYVQYSHPKGLKLIPGPRSTIPWLGRVHDVDINSPWFDWMRLTNERGGICSSVICGETHIWITDVKIAQELLVGKARITSSRPEVPSTPGSGTEAQYLPLLKRTDAWKRQRKFATMVLATAHNKRFFDYPTHETKKFLFELLRTPKNHYSLCDRYCGRIAARLGFGSPASAAAHCKNADEFIPQISPGGSPTNLLPALGALPEWLNHSVRTVRERRDREEKLWKGLMAQVRHEMDLGIAPVSYARTYFERKEAETGSKAFGFDDHEAAYAVGMLVTVAIFTIGGPLYAFLLAMLLHPDWQEKVRQEIDEKIGDRVLVVKDSPNLPILRAAIKETVRWRPPVPLGVPRLIEEDDSWNGYYLPKGGVIHAIDLAMARNPEMYPDPEAFRPERWLDKSFPTYKEPLTEHPRLTGHHGFGMGSRMCPGIELTEAELLVACGSIIGAFELKPEIVDGKERLPDPWARSGNLIGGPSPFKMDVKVRSQKHIDRIIHDFGESVAAEEAGKI